MDVADLMKQIVALYPNSFRNDATIVAWSDQFRNLLGGLGEQELTSAWTSTMADWKYAGFPKPADVLAHRRHGPTNETAIKENRSGARWAGIIARTGYGQRAAAEGVGIELKRWCENNIDKYPNDQVIDQMVRDRTRLAEKMFHVEQHPAEYHGAAATLRMWTLRQQREIDYTENYKPPTEGEISVPDSDLALFADG